MMNFLEFYNPVRLNLDAASAVVFYFLVYSFLGWLLENSYSYFTKREFFKPNFLWGPFKPMYGIAPLLLVNLISKDTSWIIVMLLCFFIPTVVEYVSGAWLQKVFNRQWWDYSDTPLQLHGHICLPFSVCWMFLSLICLKWLHPVIDSLLFAVDPVWAWIWPMVVLYLIAELAFAIRRHSFQALTDANPLQ